uniref:Uncharacterized protein n=1 Tax=Rhipicephalus appendiculatus TaxID=34631 RepID=A0A131YA15_RHIAP
MHTRLSSTQQCTGNLRNKSMCYWCLLVKIHIALINEWTKQRFTRSREVVCIEIPHTRRYMQHRSVPVSRKKHFSFAHIQSSNNADHMCCNEVCSC